MNGLTLSYAPMPGGKHTSYTLANLEGKKVVVFPEENFLATTQVHQAAVRQALESLGLELSLTEGGSSS